MTYAVQFRRGTTAEHASFTGAAGEVTVNTTTNQLIVHDGTTVGGHVIGTSNGSSGGASTLTDLNITDGTSGQVLTTDGAGTFTFATLSSGGGSADLSTIISPAAFAYVNTTSDGSGTNISWANWNAASGSMDFTFTTSQSDTNYAVISDVEGYDDTNIMVTSKTTTGFAISIYDDNGNVASPSSTGAFSIIVYSSVPTPSENTSSAGSADIEIFADMAALIAKTGMTTGNQAYVSSNNKLYMYTGTGWYLIATVQNDAPSAITNVDDQYNLTIDGTPTVITATATDPEGFPLTWSYAITSGSLGSTATISQTDNVFTITPSTNTADVGEFTLTISATDGANGAVNKVTSITLAFQITNSSYTTLLATAVDTYDNNNITDSSTNNHSITVNGNSYAGTFSPHRSGGYSNYFGAYTTGNGGSLSSPSDSSFGYGTNDFTIEFWANFDTLALSGDGFTIFSNLTGGGSSARPHLWITAGVIKYHTVGATQIQSSYAINTDQWYHIALSRSGTNTKLFINGTQTGATYTDNNDYGATAPLVVGSWWETSAGLSTTKTFHGHMIDIRVTKGLARYTTDFTPPTEPLGSDSNTTLLISNLPYIKDSSSNDHAITVNGNTTTQLLSPYDYSEYDPTVHGGSVYFDGSGDYLTVSDAFNLGTDDFTFEFWIYPGEDFTNAARNFINPEINGTGVGWSFSQATYSGFNGLTFSYGLYGSWTVGKYVDNYWVPQNQWTHLVAQRRNGTIEIYVNGVNQTLTTFNQNATFSDSADMTSSQTSRTFFNGVKSHVSSVRLVTGSYVYDGDFTPPTAPLSSSGASLHIKGTDASIIDKSQTTNVQLFDNTTGSTDRVKFNGSKSIYFDGSGDYLRANMTPVGTDDFTIEFWYNAVSTPPDYSCIFSQNPNGNNLRIFLQSGQFQFWIGSTPTISSSVGFLTLDHWYHIALVKTSGTIYLYIDGTLIGSVANTSAFLTSTIDIGHEPGSHHGPYYQTLHGYIQDFRITKGLARYTANFTPPTEPLKG